MSGAIQSNNIPFWKNLKIQKSVIAGLIMREIYSRFGRDNIGFLWMIVEPAMFTTGVIILWSLASNNSHEETPIVPFLLTGYMPLIVYRHVVATSLRCMQLNQSLLYHRRVTVLSIYLARYIVEVLGILTSFTFCMLYFGIFGFVNMPANLGLMIGGWMLYIWFCISLAMVVGGLSERYELVEKIWIPASYVSIPSTGAFFMLYWLPPQAREVMLYFPLISASEMIRGGYFGSGVPVFYDIGYVVAISFAFTTIGLFLIKDARKFLEVQ